MPATAMRASIRQRDLASTTKVPLQITPTGLLYVDAKLGGGEHQLLVDSSYPSVIYECQGDAECPSSCATDSLDGPYPAARWVCADKVNSTLQLGGSSSGSSVSVSRVPSSIRLFDEEDGAYINGVLGINLPELTGELTDPRLLETNLATTWSKYSIYVAPVGDEDSGFLSIGSVDKGPISTQGLDAHKYTAKMGKGFTINIDGLAFGGVQSEYSCAYEGACEAVISSALPIIHLPEKAYDELIPYFRSYDYDCDTEFVGNQLLSYCNADVELPTLAFTIGEQTFFVGREHYTAPYPADPSKVMILVFYDMLKPNYLALGVPFLRAIYTAFDVPSRSITFYCKEGETCQSGFTPSERPETTQPSWYDDWNDPVPTTDPDLEIWGSYNPPISGVPTDPNDPNYDTYTYTEIAIDTTSKEIKDYRTAGYVFGSVGAIVIVLLIVFAQIRKRKTVASPIAAPGASEGAYEELATPQASDSDKHSTDAPSALV